MRLWLLFSVFCLAAVPGQAAEERVSALLRTLVNGGSLPTEEAFRAAVDEQYVNQLSADEVKQFLPLARALLQDSRPEARRFGLQCFLVVTLRRSLDSEALLEPYIPSLLRIAADRTSPFRTMARVVVGNTQPNISPQTLEYIAVHLADKDNTQEETGAMACALLKDGSDRVVHDAITFVRKQDKAEVIQEVLTCIRVIPIRKTADVLALIGFGLDSPDVWVRRRAVEAVADMPLVERPRFLAQLSRLSADPSEPPEIRSLAAEALKK
jgi:HEAT repeat protein